MSSGGVKSGAVGIKDLRLSSLLLKDPLRCATLSEYSAASGIELLELMGLLDEAIDGGLLRTELTGGEVLINTKAAPGVTPELPANLWSILREGSSLEKAFYLFSLVRGLEQAGWKCVVDPAKIKSTLGYLKPTPLIAVEIRSTVAPLVTEPAQAEPSLLYQLDTASKQGCKAPFLVSAPGNSAKVADEVKRWFSEGNGKGLSIMMLEAPGYLPGNVLRS